MQVLAEVPFSREGQSGVLSFAENGESPFHCHHVGSGLMTSFAHYPHVYQGHRSARAPV